MDKLDKNKDIDCYKRYVKEKIDALLPVFSKAAIGDFSEPVPIEDEDDDFIFLYTGIEILLEVVRRRLSDLEKIQKDLFNYIEEIQIEKTKNEAIISGIGEGLVATDKEGRITLVNRTFEEIMGFKYEEVINKLITDVVKSEDEQGNVIPFKERILNRVLSGDEKIVITDLNHSYFIRKDGSRFPVRITITPIKVSNRIIGVVEIFSDVTKEQQLEHTRRDFLSLASHQVRTPLSSTRWVLETLLKGIAGKLTEKQKKYIENLYKVNMQMLKLASDTLNILRIESGIIPLNKEVFTADRIYRELLKTFKESMTNKKISLELDGDFSISLKNDFKITCNIIESIVENSINYSNEGEEIIMGIREVPGKITIFVKDKGIGIPKPEQKNIFDRFYRASNAKSYKTDGSGLGLAIAKMLSKKIGAEITFESKENIGSTFYLTLPK